MKKIFLLLFSAITLFANIGVVVDVVGNATIQRGSNSLKVTLKQELKEKDVIKTSKDAKVKIFFKDNTAVSLGQNTTFSIENYMFDGTKKSNVKFKVLKGFFKTVTGKIGKVAPNRFKLQTKNATIGIRGTVFAAKVGDEADVVMCTDGSIILFTPNGDVVVESGNSGYVKSSGEPRVKHYSNAEKKQLIENAGWHGSMSMSELREFIKKNFKEPLRSQLLGAIDNIYAKDSSESKTKTVTTNADDIGFVDDITINGREFDELPEDIEFYRDDLKDGKVIVQGLLESEDKAVSVDALHVEITTDGGDTWSRATGNGEWEWSFEPRLEEPYEFSLRVVQDTSSNESDVYTESEEPEDVHVNMGDKISIAGFTLALDADVSLRDGKLSGSGKITIPYLSKISNLSNEIVKTQLPDVTAPNQPFVKKFRAYSNKIMIEWNRIIVYDLAGYNVYRKTKKGLVKLNKELLISTAFTDLKPKSGANEYVVVAVDKSGNESLKKYSKIVYLKDIVPVKIENFKLTKSGDGVKASFTCKDSDYAGFKLFRSSGEIVEYFNVSNFVKSKSYIDKSVSKKTKYFYMIKAYDKAGNISESEVKSIKLAK